MSEKIVIDAPTAPKAIGPYSQAIKANGMLFVAGQIALDPKTGQMIQGDAIAQAEQILNNIEAILTFAGLTFGHVVRSVVYVTDLSVMPKVNPLYEKRFFYQPPARTTIQVAALPAGALIEIEVTAVVPERLAGPGKGLLA